MISFGESTADAQGLAPAEPYHEWTFPDGRVWARFHRVASGFLVRFPNLADFCISGDGLHVTCRPAPGVSEDTVEHLYLHQVVPLAQSKAGKLVFHASAIERGEHALAFMGLSGRGKSTLAIGFANRAYRLLSDDGLVVEARDGGYAALPSHPSVRLWEDSRSALIRHDERKAPAEGVSPKARFVLDDALRYCDAPRRLQRIYVLGDGSSDDVRFERMSARDALVELVRHTFLLDGESRDDVAAQLRQLADLVQAAGCYHLDYPRRFETLAGVQDAILEHSAG